MEIPGVDHGSSAAGQADTEWRGRPPMIRACGSLGDRQLGADSEPGSEGADR
jgi:hypothetical protein